MKNVEQTIISQYGNSAVISQLIQNMNAYIDPSADIDNFYNFVFNVTSTEMTTFGLQIWSRIVGIPQSVLDQLPADITNDQLQSIVLLKALSNISYASSPSINQLLQNWLGAGVRAYVADTGSMTMTYVFEFELAPYQVILIQQSGIFLRPAGVLATILMEEFPIFGFKEMGTTWAWPFNQAVFFDGGTSGIS